MRFILLLLAVAGSAAAVPVQRPLRSGPVTLSLKAVESGMQTSEGGHDDWSSDRSVYYYVNLGVG
jgi:hypothetical protein